MTDPVARILDEAVTHRIALSRFSTATVRKALATLNRTDRDLVERILRADNEGRDPAQLERLLDEVRALQADGWSVLRARLVDDLDGLAAAERDFAARMVRFGQAAAGVSLATNVPTVGQVVAAVNARPFQGRFLRDWLAEAEAGSAKRVRETLRQGFIEGRSVTDLARQIRGTRALQYRDGILEISRRGAEAMVRTAVTHTAAVSSRATYEEMGVARATFVAVLDSRTTLTCAGLNGKTFPLDKFPYPPRHVNCLLPNSLVATGHRVTSVFKRWYDGDVVVIRTASGENLTCTPNHPILTDGGWVAAGLLNVGGNVIRDAGIKRVGLIDFDDKNVEARIEDVAEAFLRNEQVTAVPVPTAAEDFHGDGMDGQVAVVATNRCLNDRIEAARSEHLGQPHFGIGGVGLSLVSGDGGLDLFGLGHVPTSDGGVSGGGEALSFSGAGAGHSGALLVGPVAESVPGSGQNPLNGSRTASKAVCDSPNTDAGDKQSGHLGGVKISAAPSVRINLDPQAPEAIGDGVGFDAQLASHLLHGLAGPVATDVIVSVERANYAGHVYNLETERGWYISENIVTHNCRSTMIPVIQGLDPVPVRDYGEWLKGQPQSVQNDILGPSRARLFREGRLTVDRFTDRAGRVLTLEQLRQRDGQAFAG